MAKRLGEILLDEGKLTEEQLQKALKAQLIFGGHLGTSLIELGYVDEEALGRALSSAFNVSYATYDILHNAPYAVIRAIPAKLVEKYKVVPIRLDGKVLHLAMMDPKNLMALDEISFVTGYRIEPWVAPEIRIYQILEKYYNIPRSQRYITLARELGKLRSPSEKIRPGQEGDEEGASAAGEAASVASRASEAAGHGAPAAVPGPRHSTDHWEKYGYGRSWREYAEEIEKRDTVAAAPAATLPEAPTPPPPAAAATGVDDFLVEAGRRLQQCESPENIADVVLSLASRRLARTAFFIVRGDRAVGWAGAGEGFHTARMKGLTVSLERGSLFSLVEEGRGHFLGNLPAFPAIRQFFQGLSVPVPRTVLLVPIRIKERIASYLYGDGGPDNDLKAIDVDTFERLAQKASLALQMIIIRSKISSA